MLTQHIALVPESEGISFSELARASAALQRQVTRDLAPAWGITATVDAFPRLEDVPVGYWPVLLTHCELGRQSGIHLDAHGQPYAQVQLDPHWSLAASRACLEMLVNPYGTRTVSAPSLRSDQGPVEFLIEVCGPCCDPRQAYNINGVAVSDFCTPSFFGCGPHSDRFSFSGAVTAPMRPLPGGHMTWYDPVSGSYWMRNHWGDNPIDSKLGVVRTNDGGGPEVSVREVLNACAQLRTHRERRLPPSFAVHEGNARRASQVHAHRLRVLLGRRLDDVDADDAVERPTATQPITRTEQVTASASRPLDAAEFEFETVPAVEATAAVPDYQLVDPLDLEEVTHPARAQTAPGRSTPPPLAPARRAQRHTTPPPPPPAPERSPSLRPVTLASTAANSSDKGRTGIRRSLPAILAAIVAIGLVWFAARNTEPRTTTPAATASEGAAAAATPRGTGSEEATPAATRFLITEPSAPQLAAPMPVARTTTNEPVEAEQAAAATRAMAPGDDRPTTPVAPKATGAKRADEQDDAKRAEARERRRARHAALLSEPPASPTESVATNAHDTPSTPSIEDLIETRR